MSIFSEFTPKQNQKDRHILNKETVPVTPYFS